MVWSAADIIGGSEVFAVELAQAMPANRVIYSIACMDTPRVLRFFQQHGLRALPISSNPKELLRLLRSGRFDLVETNRANPRIGEMAIRAGMPFVWNLLADPAFYWLNALARRFFTAMQEVAYRVVVLSPRFLPHLHGFSSDRVRIIPDGIRWQTFDPGRTQARRAFFRRQFGLGPKTVAIGLPANFLARKGQLELVEAARHVVYRHPEVRFLLFGGSFPGGKLQSSLYRMLVQEVIRHAGLSKQVRVYPFYPDRVALMAGLDIVAIPSMGEGHSAALLEAMASRKPVIGADAGGTPDLIEPGQTGLLVPPRQPLELAQALLDLLEHPKQAQRMAEAGCQKVAREFDVRRKAQDYLTLYAELIR